MMDKPLSENIGQWDGGEYNVTAAIWRTNAGGELWDTFEIGVRHKKTNKFTLIQSDKFNHQTVQEMANVIATMIRDETQCYDPEWFQRMLS